jgi:hypothetical protein
VQNQRRSVFRQPIQVERQATVDLAAGFDDGSQLGDEQILKPKFQGHNRDQNCFSVHAAGEISAILSPFSSISSNSSDSKSRLCEP